MQYLLMIYGDESAYQAMSVEEIACVREQYAKYTAAMTQAGVIRGGAELAAPPSAKTVRVRKGETVMTDGPFAEMKEQIGGYYLIEVASETEALQWAAQCPSAMSGAIEVRALV